MPFLSETLVLLRSPQILGCLVFGLLAAWTVRGDRARAPTRTFLACLAGSLAWQGLSMVVFSIGEYVRYVYPFRAFLLVLSFAFLLGYEAVGSAVARARRQIVVTVVWLGLAGLIVHGCCRNIQHSRSCVVAARSAMTGRGLIEPEKLRSYRELQDALPQGAKILFAGSAPFLLDFRRNDLFVCDRPGNISPPPGLPLDGSSEDIATYLRSVGVRYVICDSHVATLSDTTLDDALRFNEQYLNVNTWLFVQNMMDTKFLVYLQDLCTHYHIYAKNDNILAIDLTRRLADREFVHPRDAAEAEVRVAAVAGSRRFVGAARQPAQGVLGRPGHGSPPAVSRAVRPHERSATYAATRARGRSRGVEAPPAEELPVRMRIPVYPNVTEVVVNIRIDK